MNYTYLLLLCNQLACQLGVITHGDLTGKSYGLVVDTTGIHELKPADQLQAGKRTYNFISDYKCTIKSEGGPNEGEHPFEWSMTNDSLHIVIVKPANLYAL